MKRSLVLAAVSAGTAAVVLAGCAGGSGTTSATNGSSMMSGGSTAAAAPTGTPASGPHNQADLAFATDMIPHHTQAVQMSDMAAAAATNAEVKTLAADIEDAQDPEIAQMSGWLAGWGATVPSGTSMGMGTGMGAGTGMMSDADMTDLGKATGATFDRMWVTMMITHHQGAVTMAQTELADGENVDAQTLARSVVTSQTVQIAQLQALLRTLPAA